LSRTVFAGRPAPLWLLDEPFEDVPAGVLKSGKEAEVFLVERRFAHSRRLLAHKRFRPRQPTYHGELRDLGFSARTTYRQTAVYRAGWHMDARSRRAVDAGTGHGHVVIAASWPANEAQMLRRAWDAGVSVPYPVGRTDDGVLMEFIGDDSQAAPRLVHAGLSYAGLVDARDQLLHNVERLTRAGVVHADLSVYNLLWWEDRLVLIDLPQAVDARTNASAPELLHRDLANVADWFGRRGAPIDAEAVFAELVPALLF
jgi:RIO kinase 1